MALMSVKRYSPGVGVLGGLLFAVGGEGENMNPLASVEAYAPRYRCDTATWQCVSDGNLTAAGCEETCAVPTPAPPTFMCVGGQCVPGSGLSKLDCESMCTGQLYQCVSNKCTPASTGVTQAKSSTKCEANCGSSLRGVGVVVLE